MYRQELRERGRAENMVELGARYQLTPQTVLSGSLGTGFGVRSPAFRVLVGFQHILSWPLLFREPVPDSPAKPPLTFPRWEEPHHGGKFEEIRHEREQQAARRGGWHRSAAVLR